MPSVVAFLIAVAFWPGISGAATSPRWAIAAVSLWFLDWRVLPFVAVCFAVLEFDAACHWAIVSAAFCWGLNGQSSEHDPRQDLVRRRVIGAFAAGVGISGGIALAQANGWAGIDQIAAPAGLFLNKNFLGEAACLALIASLIWRQWLAALIVMPALILSTSRASWLAAILALSLLLPRRLSLWLFLGCSFFAVTAYSAGLLDSATLVQRFMFWADALNHLSWFGNGTYERMFAIGRAEYLHNEWLQLIYELGIIGFVPLIAILVAINAQSAPFIAALLVIGSFGFPLHMPATAWFAAFVIGHHLGRNNAGQRVLFCKGNVGHNARSESELSRSGA